MELKHKVWLSHCVIHMFMLISGLEYAVIFPTLWQYLLSLGVPQEDTYWMGLTMAAMTVTDIVTGLLVGRLVDVTNRVKRIVTCLNVFQLAGAILYTMAPSAPFILASRLLTGCGKSIAVVFLADICQSTPKDKRTPILLLFNIAMQVGLLVGPACNMFLRIVDVQLGSWLCINKLNAPGVLLFLLWSVFLVCVLLAYSDLVRAQKEESLAVEIRNAYNGTLQSRDQSFASFSEGENRVVGVANETSNNIVYTVVEGGYSYSTPSPAQRSLTRTVSVDMVEESPEVETRRASDTVSDYGMRGREAFRRGSRSRRNSRKSNLIIDEAEKMMGDSSRDSSRSGEGSEGSMEFYWDHFTESEASWDGGEGREEESTVDAESGDNGDVVTMLEYKNALIRDEVVALIFTRFLALFCQTSLESVVPPVMQHFFRYGDFEISVFYLCCGVELICVFIILTIVSKCVSDRFLVVSGLVVMVAALSWLTATLPKWHKGDRDNLPYFGVGVFLDLLGIPMVCDIGIALYSKLLPDRVQGVGHAVRRFVSQLAFILGPLWGSGALHWPTVMLAVPLSLGLLSLALFLLSYRRMDTRDGEGENTEAVNERTPLI